MQISLEEFITRLIEIEFSQHQMNAVDEETGLPQYLNTYISLINQGLIDLHRRFLIKKGTVMLQTQGDRLRYRLVDEVDYLLTPDVPLNLMEVLQIFDSAGRNCPMNNTNMYDVDTTVDPSNESNINIQFVNSNTLEITSCNECLRIIYRKGPNPIPRVKDVTKYKPDEIMVDIDYVYLDALTYYVAQRMFAVAAPIEGYGAAYAPSILYRKKYEEECQKLEQSKFDLEGTGSAGQRFHQSMMP